MLGRITLARLAGLALGIIIVGGGLYLTKPSGTTLAPALGDPNAAYDLGLTLTEAFFTSQVNKPPADTTGAAAQQTSSAPRHRRACARTAQSRYRKASAYGFLVPVQAIVQPRVVNGRLEMAIVKGQAGGLTAPASVAEDIETVINRQLANSLAKQDFQVIAIQPGLARWWST